MITFGRFGRSGTAAQAGLARTEIRPSSGGSFGSLMSITRRDWVQSDRIRVGLAAAGPFRSTAAVAHIASPASRTAMSSARRRLAGRGRARGGIGVDTADDHRANHADPSGVLL